MVKSADLVSTTIQKLWVDDYEPAILLVAKGDVNSKEGVSKLFVR